MNCELPSNVNINTPFYISIALCLGPTLFCCLLYLFDFSYDFSCYIEVNHVRLDFYVDYTRLMIKLKSFLTNRFVAVKFTSHNRPATVFIFGHWKSQN